MKDVQATASRFKKKGEVTMRIFFWIHQFVFGLPSVFLGMDLLMKGTTQGLIPAIALILAWIGGTLMWGFATLIHSPYQPSAKYVVALEKEVAALRAKEG